MNNAGNLTSLPCASAALLLVLVLMPSAHAQTAQPVATPTAPAATSPAPDSVPEPAPGSAPAPASEGVSAVPTPLPESSLEAAEKAVELPEGLEEPPTNEEVLELLRTGNNGKPLTVAQMSAINDMIRRMEFLSSIESRLQGMNLGLSPSPANSGPGASGGRGGPPPVPAMAAAAGALYVDRITGSSGQYIAVVQASGSGGGSGGRSFTLREGDTTDMGRVVRVNLDGVMIVSDNGTTTKLPFRAPPGIEGMIGNR